MQTEDYFSVYGSGYTERRQVGYRLFREVMPSRSHFVAAGAAVFIIASILGSFAYNVMTTAQAGALFAAKQDRK